MEPRFMMDHMVIRLGKYLRVIGCDADWNLHLRTHDLILRANAQESIFITRNRQLPHQYPLPRRVMTLTETDPVLQFRAVLQECGIDPAPRLFTKCIRCNVALEPVSHRESIRDRVHPNVFMRHDHFYRCPVCDIIFWHGSHVVNTCRKLGLELPAPPGH
jgi:uncharacterized protein